MTEDELLIAKAEDRIKECESRCMVTATGFLDPHEQSVVRARFGRGDAITRIVYYGGYDDAERVMMICLPEHISAMLSTASGLRSNTNQEVSEGVSAGEGGFDPLSDIASDLMSVIRVTSSKGAVASSSGRPLSHGDYLGALMGLGIEREALGDILIRDDGADIIVTSRIKSFIENDFRQAGKGSLEPEVHDISELILPKKEMKEFSDTVASPRLDNIISSAFGLSRGKAVTAIKQGLVFVNHMEALKPSLTLSEGDEIVVRHKGRAILSEFGGTSRKGRQYITYLKD